MYTPRDPRLLFPHDYLLKYTVLLLIPRWVTPNHFTIVRFLLTPFVLWFVYKENYTVGVPLFLLTAFTDAIDGSLARVRSQITPWGTFFDPVADKVLISSLVLLIVTQHINPLIAMLILLVEFLIISAGVIRQRRGAGIQSANVFGKIKMCLQVLGVLFLLIALASGHSLFIQVSYGTFSLAIVFAVISLFTYGI